MSARLRRAWQRRGPLAIALLPLAGLYGLLTLLRRPPRARLAAPRQKTPCC